MRLESSATAFSASPFALRERSTKTLEGRGRLSTRQGWAGEKDDFFSSLLLGFAGGGQRLVDFPDEAPFDFRDFLCAHAEDASTLG